MSLRVFHVVIPARFEASRLPGKPLLDIGRPSVDSVGLGLRTRERCELGDRRDRRCAHRNPPLWDSARKSR